MDFEVALDNHHLEGLSAKPTTALLELIWNALDADAQRVEVTFGLNDIQGIEEIRVKDDGHGMTRDEAEQAFTSLGGSWKLSSTHSRSGERLLHGRHGRGRFRAAGVGQAIRWETISEGTGERLLTVIEIRGENRRRLSISNPEPTEEPVGTTVRITGIADHPEGIGEKTAERLTMHLAVYLEQYHPTVVYDGEALDPEDLQLERKDYELELDGDNAVLTVIEWLRPVDRALYLCNPGGMAMSYVQPGIQAPGFDFTAYLRWKGFEDETRVLTPELDAEADAVIEQAREVLRQHFRERSEAEVRNQVEEWKAEEVYPYEEEPESETEEAARELFDVVAVTAREAVNAADTQGKKFSLRLLQQAIENDPGSLRRVLQEVLELPEETLEELDELLSQSTLAQVITASRSITNRLDFLKALEEMVFEPEIKGKVLERRQLHRILVNETWVFGEEFALTVDDESLRAVLKRHIKELGREELSPEELAPQVENPSGQSESIVDLMLCRSVPQGTNRREHLVVELKRPSVKVGPDEVQQIKNYAVAVSEDDRFDKVAVEWDFIVVSGALKGTAEMDARQPQLPAGQVASYNDNRVRVWAKTWGEIIEDASHRLKFVRDHLGYDPSTQQAFKYLREKHLAFVPAVIAESAEAPAENGQQVSESQESS